MSAVQADTDVELLSINTIRTLSMDAVQKANSGHPGAPMGLAPLGYLLYQRHMVYDPADPAWADRDRFVLSAGHASMLLYSLLHLTGYDLELDELKAFRQLHSRTAGHPEHFVLPGVETTTGPLGQGFGAAVGMALAERLLAAQFNRPGHEIVDHHTYVVASDGDLMEGVQSEAASLAGTLGLPKLVVFWDDNSITLDGPASDSWSEDVGKRYEAYGWRVLAVEDINDVAQLDRVIAEASQADAQGRPTLVKVKSVIGFGAPNKANSSKAHGSPLGDEEVAGAKAALGWPYPEPFTVPDEVRAHMDHRERGTAARAEWEQRLDAYRAAHPDLAADFERRMRGELPTDWDADLQAPEPGADAEATRVSSGKALNAIAAHLPELIGGSADLSSSNNSKISGSPDINRGDFTGRNINYGVREHAMAAALNGLASHGGLRVFGATFFVFTDYLRPALRMACIMKLPIVYVMTHDSIGLGEDGTTHQPVEQLAMLRATPNLHVLRPADARETVGAWRHAIERTDGPTVLVLSRQKLPVLAGTDPDEVRKGAYVVVPDDGDPDVVLLATGSEVSLAADAAEILADSDVSARVVSIPSWELFEDTDPEYVDQVLPDEVPVLAVEAAASFGWGRWADDAVTLDTFGESAPADQLFEEFGFTPEAVADAALELLDDLDDGDEPTTEERTR